MREVVCQRKLGFHNLHPDEYLSLHGDRLGQHSIGIHGRINDRWRICFRWSGGDAFAVEIVNYP